MTMGKNIVPNAHFHKDWKSHVKTWFNQPARRKARKAARIAKAKNVFPKPVAGLLRPGVRGQTQRYNYRVRLGRGFTAGELKEAGLTVRSAPTFGIAVDQRRRTARPENVARVKLYMSKLTVHKNRKEAMANRKTVKQNTHREIIPLDRKAGLRTKSVKLSELKKDNSVYLNKRNKVNKHKMDLQKARKIKKAGGVVPAAAAATTD